MAFSATSAACAPLSKVIELPVPQAKFLVQASFQLHSNTMLLVMTVMFGWQGTWRKAAIAKPRGVQCFDPVLEHFLHDDSRRSTNVTNVTNAQIQNDLDVERTSTSA